VNKRGMLCIGGQGPDPEVLKELDLEIYDMIAAADSGYHLCEVLNIKPTVLVGDMDSIRDDVRALETEIEVHPVDKDYTDTQLGCMLLLERGCTSLLVLGGGEGRIDHTLDLYYSFMDLARSADIHWITRCDHIWFVTAGRQLILEAQPHTRLSVFPEPSSRFFSEGLFWKAEAAAYSMSNRLAEPRCRIAVEAGTVMVITSVEGFRSCTLGQRIQ